MPRFNHSTQKFDANGNRIPKGRGELLAYKKANPDVIIFDSKSEYELYCLYKKDQEDGLISGLICKKTFDLVPKKIWWNNVKERKDIVRELVYIADFVFVRDGVNVVVDCKGWKQKTDKLTGKVKWSVYYDEIYKIKKKLFLWLYPEFLFEER